MKNKTPQDRLTRDQNAKTVYFDHPCCVCGQPDAPFGFGVFLRHGVKGLWYCADHKADGDAGCGMPSDGVSGAIAAKKNEGGPFLMRSATTPPLLPAHLPLRVLPFINPAFRADLKIRGKKSAALGLGFEGAGLRAGGER